MAHTSRTFITDPERLRERVKDVVRQIHEEADPHEMNAYKRFVKRNVSVFNRAYFTAYLVKMLLDEQGAERPVERRKSSRSRSNGEETVADVPPTGAITSPDGYKTLFISIGKNRRVFPKDFVGLFADMAGVSEDQFGQIKVLDNYSFVEVVPEVADRVIETCNGYEFRGRKLTVNFARHKKG